MEVQLYLEVHVSVVVLQPQDVDHQLGCAHVAAGRPVRTPTAQHSCELYAFFLRRGHVFVSLYEPRSYLLPAGGG